MISRCFKIVLTESMLSEIMLIEGCRNERVHESKVNDIGRHDFGIYGLEINIGEQGSCQDFS